MKKEIRPPSPAALKLRNFLIVFAFTAVTLLVTIAFLLFCRVETVVITGAEAVPQPMIMDAAAIKAGRHLFGINQSKIEGDILEKSPYIQSVSFRRKFPSTIEIHIEEYDLSYYIEYEDRYYLITSDLFILEETTPEDAAQKGAVPLTLPKIKDPKVSKENPDAPKVLTPMTTLTFDTKTDKEWVLSLLSAIDETAFRKKITSVMLHDPFDFRLYVSGKYTVLLGNRKDFEQKLLRVEHALSHIHETMYGLTGIFHAEKDAPVTFALTGVTDENTP